MGTNALANEIDGIKERVNVKSRDIARLVGTSPQTVSRWYAGESSPPTDRLRPLLTLNWIATRLSEFFEPEEARLWLYRPHPLLDGASPADYIEQERVDEVLALIDHLESGAYV